jgi:ribosomal protein S18 acetylase RimI-like enzyme
MANNIVINRPGEFVIGALTRSDIKDAVALAERNGFTITPSEMAGYTKEHDKTHGGQIFRYCDHLVGFLLRSIISRRQHYAFINLDFVLVDREWRRCGVGRLMAGHYVKLAQEGRCQLRAMVAEDNLEAQLWLRDFYGKAAGPVFTYISSERLGEKDHYSFVYPLQSIFQKGSDGQSYEEAQETTH